MEHDAVIDVDTNTVSIIVNVNGQDMHGYFYVPRNMPVKRIIAVSHKYDCYFDVYMLTNTSYVFAVYSAEFEAF